MSTRSTRSAIRLSLRYLAAALVAGLAFTFAPTAPAAADEPVVRQPRLRIAAPRVRAPVRHVRHVPTVVRTRYVPVYYAGCGCGQPVALPYYWAVRYARYRYAYGYYQ